MQGREFKKFQASSLYCPKCKQATEVRERLLLVLPDGDLFNYYCSLCGTSVDEEKWGGDDGEEMKKLLEEAEDYLKNLEETI